MTVRISSAFHPVLGTQPVAGPERPPRSRPYFSVFLLLDTSAIGPPSTPPPFTGWCVSGVGHCTVYQLAEEPLVTWAPAINFGPVLPEKSFPLRRQGDAGSRLQAGERRQREIGGTWSESRNVTRNNDVQCCSQTTLRKTYKLEGHSLRPVVSEKE